MIRAFAIIFLTTCLIHISEAQRAMSLEDCVQYALAHHPEITLAQLDIRDADWQIRENTAIALPQFSLGVNYQYFFKQPSIPAEAFGFEADPGTKLTFALKNNLSGTVGVNQLLFSNSYLLGVKAAREYRKYADLRLQATKAHLRNAVTDAYLPALLLEENVTILDKNIDVQQQFLGETQEVHKAGFAEQLDVDRLQYTLARLINERENLTRQREILIDVLQFAMHMPVKEDIALGDDLTALLDTYASINPDEELDYMKRPDYVTVLKARELSEIQVALYEKPWLPTLAGFAQYQPSLQGNDKLFWIPSAIVGLQVNMPIYDGGLSRSKKERATVTALKTDIQKEMLEHAFDLELESARKQFANARSRMQNEEKNLQLAQRIYDTSETKFQSGIGSSLEVTQAQIELYQSQALLIQSRYEMLQARVALKKALGK
ncbi:MAG TPA: TolC family protein [Saprospiraceae bacterium]|nr:TolC family protein [Saprospiraceae bacterium]